MAEQSIADDLLRNGYERWERLEGEKAAIGEDLKELFAELKGHGFTPKALRESFRRVRNIADADQQEHDAVVDLYVSSLTGARPAPARVENIDEIPAEDPEVTAQKARLAALRADPAMSIVSADRLKSEPQPAAQAVQGGDSHAEPVASRTNQPETATSSTAARMDVRDNSKGPDQSALPADPAAAITPPAGTQAPSVDPNPSPDKSVGASASAAPAAEYGAPGVITWERTPPEGVRRHEISQAFGDAGQDSAVIEDDLANAASAPIVKIGNEILDGWARYMTARNMDIEYPVVQYEGSDPLIDCIRWNFQGRMLNSEQTFRIAQKLTKLNPKRKADIYAAMELGMELVQ